MSSTRLALSEIDDEFCAHVLIDRLHGTCVRVIEAAADWAPEEMKYHWQADEITQYGRPRCKPPY